MRQFKALSTFESPETQSTYLEGFSYTIRPANRLLNALAELWFIQKKIEFLHDDKRAEFKGRGFVLNPPPEPPPIVTWAPVLEPVILEQTPEPVERVVTVESVNEPVVEPIIDQPEPQQDVSFIEKTKAAWRALWQ